MSTAVATTESTEPQAVSRSSGSSAIKRMMAVESELQAFRADLTNPDIGDLAKTLIQAEAINYLESAFDDSIMGSVMKLMNNPLGFKTDRPPGAKDSRGNKVEEYPVWAVKRCVIVALLSGAKLTGNQFNIIAWNCYLTKEFTYPQILKFPGLTNFEYQTGTGIVNRNSATVEARASWEINGEVHELRCVKENDFDGRIVVKCYESSSPDEIRGKAEAKLFQRVLRQLTGLNLYDSDENTIDGSVSQATISDKRVPEQIESKQSDPGVGETARQFLSEAESSFEQMDTVNDVKRACQDRIALAKTWECDEGLRLELIDAISNAADLRISEIRASRGK